jgi:hypothetical protein
VLYLLYLPTADGDGDLILTSNQCGDKTSWFAVFCQSIEFKASIFTTIRFNEAS